jgi:antitoxin component YwqK of YwqJK toxin-antitoxin module
MNKIELTKDELEKLYYLPPKDVEKETEFQITYRMGRNSLVLELIKKIDEELTPHIKYYPNGNVWVKGQKNSKGQHEGIWEGFYPNGNIQIRTPFKEGKVNGIQEWFDKQGNITETRLWKNGELIEETKPELTPYIKYHPNGNVYIKGQKNSKGQQEGIWEWFYEDGNIFSRAPHKGGEKEGIEEIFYKNGNTRWRIPYKEGKADGIEEWFDEQGNIIQTRLWKDGKLIEETKPKPQPDPQLENVPALTFPFLTDEPDEVPYHSICSCNPKNGGSGICGCIMGNKMVRNPKKYLTTLGTANTSTARIDLNSLDSNFTNS